MAPPHGGVADPPHYGSPPIETCGVDMAYVHAPTGEPHSRDDANRKDLGSIAVEQQVVRRVTDGWHEAESFHTMSICRNEGGFE